MAAPQQTAPGRASSPEASDAAPSAPSEVAAPRPGMGKARKSAVALLSASWRPAVVMAGLLGIWWLVTALELVPPYLIPSPAAVWDVFVAEWPQLLQHTAVTTQETILGFILAAILGVVTAVILVYSPTAEKSVYPLILFAQVIPKIAIAPILVVWFGFGMTPKVILAVLIAFFPVVVSAVAGLRSVDPELLELSSTMGASRWKTFRKIRFPTSLPHLMSGLKVAVTLAVTGAVVGEFVGADQGLGYVLLLASGNLNAPLLFAVLILMSVIGIVLFLLVELLERLVIPWHASRRNNLVLAGG